MSKAFAAVASSFFGTASSDAVNFSRRSGYWPSQFVGFKLRALFLQGWNIQKNKIQTRLVGRCFNNGEFERTAIVK
jgi:hypothetical protein